MITVLDGDLFKSDCDVLVNTVNIVGIMGKGIALEFKKRYPENFTLYRKACEERKVNIGQIFITDGGFSPEYIFNFPTKKHWRDPSNLSYIHMGLIDMVNHIKEIKPDNIAIPALGCTNGGLDWNIVRPIIECALEPIKEQLDIYLYNPRNPNG
jgi:O-acetyl-ADP-ribose deacetylase (regulator of RNase III)